MIRSAKNLNIIQEKKNCDEKIVMITAYDFPSASAVDKSGADIILVGDSLGVAVLGYNSTREVTMDDMEHHLRAVVRGSKNTFIVCDLPINSYRNKKEVVANSIRLLEAGCQAVKFEGYLPEIADALKENNIPFMGHIGLTPQTIIEFKVQGKIEDDALVLKEEAIKLQEAGAFSVVLECIPYELGKSISKKLKIPTIGIGAGIECDGQVLVYNDLLGIFDSFKPRFVRNFKNLKSEMLEGCKMFVTAVKNNAYPTSEESYN